MADIAVLVVDDSVVVRRLVTSAIDGTEGLRVVGTAPNGKVALAKLEQVAPDIVTLDIEMPEMDGLQTVKELRRTHPQLPVIMFSTLTQRGAAATFEALSNGASDYVTKPANVGSVNESILRVQQELVPKIRALCGRAAPAAPTRPRPAASALVAPSAARRVVAAPVRRAAPGGRVDVLTIGCSTGGPEALTSVLTALPADLPVPVVVVQHMPALFTRLFAERLDRSCRLGVSEATDGEELRPGHVYVAPGDYHMEVVPDGTRRRTRLQQGPPENFCRPAVDVLFRSVATTYGGNSLAVVLTGMGADGRRGCEVLKDAGAAVVVQDEATSVVWGMPGSVAEAGLADEILPITEVAAAISSRISRSAGVSGPTAALAGRGR